MKQRGIFSLALLVLGALLSASWFFRPQSGPRTERVFQVGADCDLHLAPCEASGPGGQRIRLEIQPNSIPLLKPLVFLVVVEGMEPRRVQMEITGLNMDMGYNRLTLTQEAPDYYSGTTALPICSQHRMEWQALIRVTAEQGVLSAPFTFYTQSGEQ